jgi:hypothetical protein
MNERKISYKGVCVGGGGGVVAYLPGVQLSLGRKTNYVYIQNKNTKENVQSCTVRRKPLPGQQGSHSEEVKYHMVW